MCVIACSRVKEPALARSREQTATTTAFAQSLSAPTVLFAMPPVPTIAQRTTYVMTSTLVEVD